MARRLPPGRASVTGLYSRAELLDAVRRWRRLYGCAPVRSDWDPVRARQRCDPDLAAAKAGRYRSGQWPSADTVRNHFGSFGAAIEAAGLHPRPGGVDVRWSDEAILEALRDVAYEWPQIHAKILAADILILATPTWIGQPSSIIKRALERMDALLSETDAEGVPVARKRTAWLRGPGRLDPGS